MNPVGRKTALNWLAALALPVALLLLGTASANATVVFDGSAYKTKPATISGFHDHTGKGSVSSAKLLIGGSDAKPGDYGRINWTKWTKKKAIGFGTGWHQGEISYDSEVGANPWNGGKLRVILRRKKGKFNRMQITQRTSWRSEAEQGKCDYSLFFAFKPNKNRAHPWMLFGLGGGWPLEKRPCAGIKVS